MSNVTVLFKAPVQPHTAFDDFWKVYPRRKDKLDAQRAWAKALKIATAEEIIEGAKRYAAHAEAPFIKLPATFLNKGSWMDEELQVSPLVTRDSRDIIREKALARAANGDLAAQDWLKRNT